MATPTYSISCAWDAEADVWCATSDDVPGLIAESDSLDTLIGEVRQPAPELLGLNRGVRGPVEISLVVVANIKSRHTANEILKQAGLPKAF